MRRFSCATARVLVRDIGFGGRLQPGDRDGERCRRAGSRPQHGDTPFLGSDELLNKGVAEPGVRPTQACFSGMTLGFATDPCLSSQTLCVEARVGTVDLIGIEDFKALVQIGLIGIEMVGASPW